VCPSAWRREECWGRSAQAAWPLRRSRAPLERLRVQRGHRPLVCSRRSKLPSRYEWSAGGQTEAFTPVTAIALTPRRRQVPMITHRPTGRDRARVGVGDYRLLVRAAQRLGASSDSAFAVIGHDPRLSLTVPRPAGMGRARLYSLKAPKRRIGELLGCPTRCHVLHL
jgi:hypothetical protein